MGAHNNTYNGTEIDMQIRYGTKIILLVIQV